MTHSASNLFRGPTRSQTYDKSLPRQSQKDSFRSSSRSMGSMHRHQRRMSSRMSSRSRSSEWAFKEDLFPEPPTKCRCEHCQMHTSPKSVLDELERINMHKNRVLKAVEVDLDELIKDLEQLVKFKSVSVDLDLLLESCNAVEWLANRLANLKFRINEHTIPDNPANCFEELHQKVLFAKYFSSPTKNTLLIYGHLDVLPAKRDYWNTDPFELNLKEGRFYGRGVTSGKGMLACWLHAIECWLDVHEDLPINIKFIVDTLHEVGSTGLQDYVTLRREFFLDVDYIIFNANSWLNNHRPVIACSLTGWAHFGVELQGANKSLEGGLASGLVYEPMVGLCHLMNQLVNDRHEIEIPYIETNVKHLSTAEWHLLEEADFSKYEYKQDLYVHRIRYDTNKVEMLQNRWCKPTLTMHGVEGAASRPECSRILPMRVMGKFSIKLVPEQDVNQVQTVVKNYLKHKAHELDISTHLNVRLLDFCEPSIWPTNSKLMKCVQRAVSYIYHKEAMTTEAIPICMPIASVLRKLTNKPIILLPFSKRLDRHSTENESIQEYALMRHSKVCATLLFELSSLRPKCKCDVIHEYCNLRGYKERLDAMREFGPTKPFKSNLLSSIFRLRDAHPDPPQKKASVKMRLKKFCCLPFKYKRAKKRL